MAPRSQGSGAYPSQPPERLIDVTENDTCLLICGDAEEGLDLLSEGSVQTAVTSPPYWSLRDYWATGQIGRADTLSGDQPTIDNSI